MKAPTRTGTITTAVILMMFFGALAIISVRAVEREWSKNFQDHQRRAIEDHAAALRAKIEREIAEKVAITQYLAAVVELDPPDLKEKLSIISERLLRGNPDIVNVAAAPDLIVRYVYPYAANRSVIGFDLRADHLIEAVRLSISTGETIVSGPVDLVQGGRGFITRLPVHIIAEDTQEVELWGVVSIVFDEEKFLEEAGVRAAEKEFRVAIRGVNATGGKGDFIFGDASIFEVNPVTEIVNLPYGSWQVFLAQSGEGMTPQASYVVVRYTAAAFGVAAFIVSLLLLRFWVQKRRAQDQLQQAIECIDDGFALYDRNDRLVMCNDRYRSYYNSSADLFVEGASFEWIIREGVRRGQYADAIGREEEWIKERLEAHAQGNRDVEQKLDDGRWLRIAEQKTPDGSTVGFRVDITELKKATEVAQSASRAKTEFLNTVSHEFRTPLTVIIGFAAFLIEYERLPAYQKLERRLSETKATMPGLESEVERVFSEFSGYASRMKEAGEHLLGLVQDLLDYSSIESGGLRIEPAVVSVDSLMRTVWEQFEPIAADQGIRLSVESQGEVVYADELRIRQTLINLVGNALKFTRAGEVRVWAEQVDEYVLFHVEDTGCGIPPEHVTRIFEGFYQADASASREFEGNGLGLSICKRIVELHGGEIHVTSTPAQGSQFTFSVPSKLFEVKAGKRPASQSQLDDCRRVAS